MRQGNKPESLYGTDQMLMKDKSKTIKFETNLRNTDYNLIKKSQEGPGYRFDHIKSIQMICNLQSLDKVLLDVDKVITKPKYLKDIQEEYYDEYRYRGHKVLNVNKLRDLPRDYFGYFGLPVTAIGSRNELNDMIDYIELIKKPVVNGKSKFQRFLCKWKNWEEPEEIS